MHLRHLAAVALATVAVVAPLAALQRTAGPQGKYTLTGRNTWRITCSTGAVIDPFYGTYLDALNTPYCAPGYPVHVYDKGLDPIKLGSDYVETKRVVFLPRTRPTPPVGEAAALVEAQERAYRSVRETGTCAAAICRDSAGNRYDVVYLEAARPKRFDCAAAGLLNFPGSPDVAGRANRITGPHCPIGVRLRP